MTKTVKDKSQAEIEIDALAEVFGIATTGFEDFYKKTKDNAKGVNSTAASSGYCRGWSKVSFCNSNI